MMDLSTNLPVKIDVFVIKDVSSALFESEIDSGVGYSYPDDFDMDDLSPASYDTLVNRIKDDETTALDFNR